MQRWIVVFCLIILSTQFGQAEIGQGQQIVSYQPGAGAILTQANSALGLPNGLIGVGTPFESILSPFNPPYEASQLLQIGPGGQITLKLSHFAIVGPGKELGVFSNVGIFDAVYPTGKAGSPISLFGSDKVNLEVSEDNVIYFNLGEKNISMFHNFYTDLASPYSSEPGSQEADFSKPFLGEINDFAGKDYAQIKQILAGSAGGNWFDVGELPVSKIGYVRLSLSANANKEFELDAVTINSKLLGAPINGATTSDNRSKIAILRPLKKERVARNFMAIGAIKSKTPVLGVEYSVNQGPWLEANFVGGNWSAIIDAPEAITFIQLEIRSFDQQGQRSKSRVRTYRIAQ